MKTRYFLIAAFSVLFFSCKTALQIEKPTESYIPGIIPASVSDIPLQVELDVKKLETALNRRMNGLLYEGSNISGQDLSVKVWKAGNFTFTVNNNIIEYQVPLKIWSRFAWKIEKFGLTVSDHYEANGSILLTYRTAISVDKNWQLVSKTTSSGYKWIETPRLNIIGINVPVTPIANFALNQSESLVSKQIDRSLAQAVNLKKYVSDMWTQVQQPMQLNADNNLWIRVTPKDVFLAPFTTSGSKLNVSVALSAIIETFVGSKPTQNAVVKLPDLKMLNRPVQTFNLNIAADVTYDKISEIAKAQLKGKTFKEGNKSITINDLSIYGSAGKAVFMADVSGSLKGKVYFTGNLTYDPQKTAIVITEPEFDIRTKNALVKSASWLMHGFILKQITPYLTYPVKPYIDQMKNDANQMISGYKLYQGVSLFGKLTDVSVQNLSLVPGAVRMQANLKGNIGLKVGDLSF